MEQSNLEPLGGPHVVTRVLVSERGGRESQRRRHEEERDHEPRKAGSFTKCWQRPGIRLTPEPPGSLDFSRARQTYLGLSDLLDDNFAPFHLTSPLFTRSENYKE